VVSIYYPAQGAEVEGQIELKANATDNVGVKAVFFYVDGKLHTMIMNAPPYVAQWDTTRTADGPHVLKASAWDEQENRGDSAEVTVLVKNRSQTTAEVTTATAAPTAGTEQVPVVATGPIADAGAQPQPAVNTGVVAQTFGGTPTVRAEQRWSAYLQLPLPGPQGKQSSPPGSLSWFPRSMPWYRELAVQRQRRRLPPCQQRRLRSLSRVSQLWYWRQLLTVRHYFRVLNIVRR